MSTSKQYKLIAAVLALALLAPVALLSAQEAAADAEDRTDTTTKAAEKAEGAEEAATDKEQPKLSKLWEYLLHYIELARADLAKNYTEAILESGAKPRELYLLTTKTPNWRERLTRGSQLPGMKDTIAKVRKMIETGYEAERTDPQQISNSIKMLGKSMTGYELAIRRLRSSGEYAMPQLIQTLQNPKADKLLKERIVAMLSKMGKGSVRPMAVALKCKNPNVQAWLAKSLAQIGYPHATPQLKELMEDKATLADTKKVAKAALFACGGKVAMKKPLAELYYELAESYYYRRESILPDSRYPKANVWYWKKGLGLTYKQVPRQIFCDVYAMRYAAKALERNPKFYPAVSLWLAANLKRQSNLSPGQKDPTRAPGEPSADYYALASPAKYLQHVLARALRDHDSAVAIGAIKALRKTAGAKSLILSVSGGTQPLVKAMSYPDRNVQFLAALALANALPSKHFTDDHVVMRLLSKALRQQGLKRVLLMAAGEGKNALKDKIRAAGFEIIDEPDLSKAMAAVKTSAGVDVTVIAGISDPQEVIITFRRNSSFVTMPIVLVGKGPKLAELAHKDGRTILMAPAGNPADALAEALKLGAGVVITPAKATEWAVRAAEAIRLLGITGNKVLDISLTRKALLEALGDKRAKVQVAAAGALATMQDPKAQRGVAALATDDKASEAVRIRAFGALSESIRRFGNELTDELTQAVLGVVRGDGSPELKNTAAQALGAMNLPSEKIISLIVPQAEAK